MIIRTRIIKAGMLLGIFAGCLFWLSHHMVSAHVSATEPVEAGGQAGPVIWARPVDARFNLYQMGSHLYRSALPDKEANVLLSGLGVTTVVNFYQRSDAEWLNNPQVKQIHLPFHADRVKDEDVIRALSSIREAEQQGPVLMHCKHGQSRTGLMAAMYRLVYEGWSKEQALDEMRNGGFGGGERLSDAESYIEKVDVAKIRMAIENHECSTRYFSLCYLKRS